MPASRERSGARERFVLNFWICLRSVFHTSYKSHGYEIYLQRIIQIDWIFRVTARKGCVTTTGDP